MRVKCIALQPSKEQQRLLGSRFIAGRTRYPIDLGGEYTVLGVGFWDEVTWFDIAASPRALVSLPAFLFEITNPKPSRHWEARLHKDGSFMLWPPSFYHQHYHDDVSEGVSEAVDDFQHLRQLLEDEAGQAQ
jgi:hypothetical protein